MTRACAMAAGTRIEVRELFFNTPARLKFLKTLATEQGAIAESFQRARAGQSSRSRFASTADGRVVFDLPRANSVLERVRQVFGAKLATKMLAVRRSSARAFARSGLAAIEPGIVRDGEDDFHLRQRPRGARPDADSRSRAGVPDADPARTPSGGGAVRRYAATKTSTSTCIR